MWLWVLGFIAVLILILIALSVRLARGYDRALALGQAQWREAVATLDESAVEAWAQCFVDTARDKLHLNFDPPPPEAPEAPDAPEAWRSSAELLVGQVTDPQRRHELLKAFHQADLGYAGLVAAGAYLGDLLVRHAGAQWTFPDDHAAPRLTGLAHDDEHGSLSRPFDTMLDLFWDRGPVELPALIAQAVATSDGPKPLTVDDRSAS